tara:strand:+ start:1033 stop:1209 length:177 start_codon:yes stop_codon:yes gene_type:complete
MNFLEIGWIKKVRKNGAATRTRTADLMITNQLLYQLSYCGTPDLVAEFSKGIVMPCPV